MGPDDDALALAQNLIHMFSLKTEPYAMAYAIMDWVERRQAEEDAKENSHEA